MKSKSLTTRQRDAGFAYPLAIDRKALIAPQMTAAMIGLHRVFGDCQARDLLAVGFTQSEIDQHHRLAGLMAYAQAPEAANDVHVHLSDEAVAAGLTASVLTADRQVA